MVDARAAGDDAAGIVYHWAVVFSMEVGHISNMAGILATMLTSTGSYAWIRLRQPQRRPRSRRRLIRLRLVVTIRILAKRQPKPLDCNLEVVVIPSLATTKPKDATDTLAENTKAKRSMAL
jgi:hypothetical protein